MEGWKAHLTGGQIGLEDTLFNLMVEGWKTQSKRRENRDGKCIILIDGRGLETTLNDEGKIRLESALS